MEKTMVKAGRVFPITVLVCSTLITCVNSFAQDTQRSARPARTPVSNPAQPEQDTTKVPVDVSGASAQNIQRIIEKLVSFGNRSTLSAQDDDAIAKGQGIGAAREWLKSEFETISKDCGGCLEVKTDEFINPVASRIPQPTKLVNVYAVLRGTDPENAKRIYLVSGHYDSRNSVNENITDPAPGANDDASGTAVSLESARLLSKFKFPATIIFLTVPGEEQGLNGSKHFAQMAKEKGWDIEGVLNNDIVGGDMSPGQNPNVVRVFSEGIPTIDVPPNPPAPTANQGGGEGGGARTERPARQPAVTPPPATGCALPPPNPAMTPGATPAAAPSATPPTQPTDVELRRMYTDLRNIRSIGLENDSPSRQLARFVADVARSLGNPTVQPLLVYRQDRYLRGGDHTSFNESGFAAVRFTEYRENFDHQHQTPRSENGTECGDYLKFVDFNYVARVAKLNAAVLASLATAPAPPARVRMNTRRLDNDSEITWDPSPGGLATDYEVVWRTTDSPNWTNAEKTDGKTTLVLQVSKDNVIFGVRAVDAKGNRSVPVVPSAQR